MDELHFIKEEILGKRILILGFGREGQATVHFLQQLVPGIELTVADSNKDQPRQFQELSAYRNITWRCGQQYLEAPENADIVVKSPGIPLKFLPADQIHKVTSQTEWFIRGYRNQICGITGTKGKSTTSSLLYHLLKESGKKAILVGNIGIPPFTMLDQIDRDTIIVFELSCHQLQHIRVSPASAILLNIFQEHLDHYNSLEEYQLTKINIGLYQQSPDILVYHADDPVTLRFMQQYKLPGKKMSFSLHEKEGNALFVHQGKVMLKDRGRELVLVSNLEDVKLKGDHNYLNIMAAAAIAYTKAVTPDQINSGVHRFEPLEHRLEPFGNFHGISFYNDSISTIPESTVQALKTLKNVYTLILGGVDRGIGYGVLTQFLPQSGIKLLIVTGAAGKRIKEELELSGFSFEIFEAHDYNQVVTQAINKTPPGKVCLLSPAAASYDWFKNFEERGKTFKTLIQNYPEKT